MTHSSISCLLPRPLLFPDEKPGQGSLAPFLPLFIDLGDHGEACGGMVFMSGNIMNLVVAWACMHDVNDLVTCAQRLLDSQGTTIRRFKYEVLSLICSHVLTLDNSTALLRHDTR